jgi:hypothetical protein
MAAVFEVASVCAVADLCSAYATSWLKCIGSHLSGKIPRIIRWGILKTDAYVSTSADVSLKNGQELQQSIFHARRKIN